MTDERSDLDELLIETVREAIEALMDGGDVDSVVPTSDWMKFVEWAWFRLDSESRQLILQAVSYKNKPMPFGDRTTDQD